MSAGLFKILVWGEVYHFKVEDDEGIVPYNRDGTKRKSAWPTRVWVAVYNWEESRCSVGEDGYCNYYRSTL